jgi:hypothetical protein
MMSDKIVLFIFFIPVFAILAWIFFDPRGSLLFGRRWMYDEEPELSEWAIRYAKVASAISIVLLAIIFMIFLFK